MAHMRKETVGKEQWGGFAEAVLIAHRWQVEVGFFVLWGEESDSSSVSLMCEPVVPKRAAGRRVCALWRRTHYDLLVLSDEQWQYAQTS